jgi:hypothetical protein
MHTVKTTIVTTANGEISGYGFCVEAENTGVPEEIAACITASLDMLRATITASFAPTDPPAGYAPAQPPADLQPPRTGVSHTPSVSPTPSTQPPQTPEEAEARFYVRYSASIGGQDWASVRRYLKEPRRPEPASVEQWIATAEAVRNQSRSEANPRPESSSPPAQRKHARH